MCIELLLASPHPRLQLLPQKRLSELAWEANSTNSERKLTMSNPTPKKAPHTGKSLTTRKLLVCIDELSRMRDILIQSLTLKPRKGGASELNRFAALKRLSRIEEALEALQYMQEKRMNNEG
jgi:hypothetical protein